LSYKKYTALPSLKKALYADIQDILKKAHIKIGFKHIRFNAPNDDFSNFLLLDKAIHFVLSLGLKPALVSRLTPPNTTLEHLNNRFGHKHIKEWLIADEISDLRSKVKLPALLLSIFEDAGNGEKNVTNDMCFMASSAVKALLKNPHNPDNLAYFCLIDEANISDSPFPFIGGHGLLTINGIKKPLYHVFKLLNCRGYFLISKGDGYYITKLYGKIQVLLYNHRYFDALHASGKTIDDAFKEGFK
jgi:hypothetical protein